MSLLGNLPKLIAEAMGQTLFRSATLHAKAPRSSDGRGGWIGGQAIRLPCRALVVEYSDHQRGLSGIPSQDRKALVLSATISQSPQVGDILVLDGTAWAILKVKADPANASYEAHATRAPMPSGDTTAATGATILDAMPSIVSASLGRSIFRSATLHAKAPRTSDGRGGWIGGDAARLSCRALVVEYSDFQRGADNIPSSDRNAIILADTISQTPKAGDVLVLDGEAWTIAIVGADPANASYTAQATRAPMPSGDTTEPTGAGLMDVIPSIVNVSMGPTIFRDATFYSATERVTDGRGGTVATYAELQCKALIVDYTDHQRSVDDIPAKDRRATILSITLSARTPKPGDILFIDGKAWTLVEIGSDPARATFDGRATPGAIPTIGRTGILAVTLQGATLTAIGRATIMSEGVTTLDGATLEATGTSPLYGAGAVTLENATVEAEGRATIVGALAVTLDGATQAGAGSPAIAGAAALALTGASIAASGSPVIVGASGAILAPATASGAGYQRNAGALAVTLDDATVSSGGLGALYGAGSPTLAGATVAATGTPTLQGAGSMALAGAGVTAEGYQRNAGAVAASLAGASVAGSGSPRIVGASASSLASASVIGAGYQRNAGASASTLAGATMAGAGSPVVAGASASTLAGATVTGAGYQRNAGAASITLAGAGLTASSSIETEGAAAITLASAIGQANGTITNPGQLASSLAGASLVADGYQANWGALAKTLAGATLAAAGSPRIVGASAPALAGASVVGAGYQRNAGAASISLAAASVAAAGTSRINGAAAPALASAVVVADGYQRNAGAASITLTSATLSASSVQSLEGDASIALAGATAVGAGYQANWGALAKTLEAATVSATGSPRIVGASAQTLASATVVADGYQRNAGALAQTLASATATGAGTSRINGASAITLGGATVAGAGTSRINGASAITAAGATVAAAGTSRINGAAAVTLGDATVVGAGTSRINGASAPTLAGATLSAAGTVTTSQTDYVVGDPNELNGGTWFDIDIGSITLGTAIDGLPQPIILATGGADYARQATTIDADWTFGQTYYFKIEFNFGTSGKLGFWLYDGANEAVFTWDGTNILYQTNGGGTISNVVQYTVDGHKEMHFQVVSVRTNPTIEIGVGPNSLTGGHNITLFDYHVSDTAWPVPSSGVTGTLAKTLDAATVSAAGTVGSGANAGALDVTLAGATVAGAGYQLNVGALAKTLDNSTVSAAGTVTGGGAITFVGGRNGGKDGATSGNTTVPLNAGLTGGSDAAVQAGDLVLVVFSTASTADRTLAITTGYTLIASELYANGTFDTNLRFAYKFMPSTPDASVLIGPTGSTADGGSWAIHVYRGVNATTPLDVAAVTATGTGTARPNPPAITPVTSGAVVVVAAGSAAADNETTAFTFAGATNLTQNFNRDTNESRTSMATYAWTSGALDPAAAGAGSNLAADSWAAITIALRPA